MAANARKQLVDFVVARALEPVMRARPDGRSQVDRRKLQHVQDATRAEIERYRNYGSAEDVVVNFRRDLSSRAAEKVHRALRALDLPTIEDIRDALEAKAEDLGVRPGS